MYEYYILKKCFLYDLIYAQNVIKYRKFWYFLELCKHILLKLPLLLPPLALGFHFYFIKEKNILIDKQTFSKLLKVDITRFTSGLFSIYNNYRLGKTLHSLIKTPN